MIVMEDYYKQKDNRETLQILGFGLVKIFELNSDRGLNIIFQKGIGFPLIQNVLEFYMVIKNKIIFANLVEKLNPLLQKYIS